MKSYKQKIKFCIFVSSLIVFFNLMIDLVCYPECYFTTWKYQLKNDIIAGEQKAVQYYQENYINRGRILFDQEVYINE